MLGQPGTAILTSFLPHILFPTLAAAIPLYYCVAELTWQKPIQVIQECGVPGLCVSRPLMAGGSAWFELKPINGFVPSCGLFGGAILVCE